MASANYPVRGGGSVYWQNPVADQASLPASGVIGEVRITLDASEAYTWDGATWIKITGSGGGTPIDLTTDVTNVLPIANGGTNSSTALSGNRAMISSSGKIVEASAITASRALISDSNGLPTHSAVTATELGYVDGVTSSIQTQLDAKLSLSGGTLTGDLTLNADPSSALHAATKQYVDAVAAGTDPKPSVKAATTADLTRSGEQSVDGVSLTAGMRCLVKNQTDALQNGIYVVAAGAWTRAADMNHWDEVPGAFCFVEEGSTNAGSGWVCTSIAGGTIGTDDIDFVQFSGVGTYTADGQGIELTGSQFSLELDGSSLAKSSSGLKIATGGVSNNEIASGAAITRSKLASGTANRLVYNDGSGVMADLSAITASRALISDANGLPTHSTVTSTELSYLSGVTSAIQTQLDGKQASLPSQTNNAGKVLGSDGSSLSWVSLAASEINAVTNHSAVSLASTGTTAGTGHTVARTSGANSPLNPIVPTAFDIECSTQQSESSTSGVYWSLTMPSGLLNKKLKVEFYVTVPSSDVWRLSVYDGSTRLVLSTDSSSVTTLPAGFTGKFTAYFESTANTSYSVNVTCTTRSGANHLYLTNLIVGPDIQSQGAVVGEWQSWTPTVSGISTSATAGRYRRVGSSIHLVGSLTANGSASGSVLVTLPLSLTVNSSAIPYSIGDSLSHYGSGWFYTSSTDRKPITNYAETSTQIGFIDLYSTKSIIGASDMSSGNMILFDLMIPIAEWAGSGTVNLAQNDVEYAASTTGTWDADAAAGNTVYGPAGATISGSLAADRTKVVRFITPIQPSDSIVLEFQNNGDWVPAATYRPFVRQNSTYYGAQLSSVSGNDTDVSVFFGRYSDPSGTTYASSGSNWSSGSEAAWRVKKCKAGAAVGFGLAANGSSGLINHYNESSVTASTAGALVSSVTVKCTRVGNVVTCQIPQVISTIASADTLRFSTSHVPSGYRPAADTYFIVRTRTNGTSGHTTGLAVVSTSGQIQVWPNVDGSTAFTNAQSGGIYETSLRWLV